MPDYYAFDRDVSMDARMEIIDVKQALTDTIEGIATDVSKLAEGWEGSESDSFREIMGKWNDGATGVKEILTAVKQALAGVQNGTDSLRRSITEVLEETT